MRKGYGGVFHGGIFLRGVHHGGISRRRIFRGRIWRGRIFHGKIFRGGVLWTPEYIVKAVKCLPNHLRNSFYKSYSNIILERNSFASLEQFEKWLDTKVKNNLTLLQLFYLLINRIVQEIILDQIILIKMSLKK